MVDEVANAPVKTVHIKYYRYSYSDAHKQMTVTDTPILYTKSPTRAVLEKIAEHEPLKVKDEKTFINNWRKDVHIPTEFEQNRPAFSEMFTEFEGMWDKHLRCIDDCKYRIDLTNDEVGIVHSVPYGAGPIAT